MGRIQRWPRLAVARWMNKGNLLASLLVEEGSRSTSKHRLIFYAPQLHSVLLDPFRSPRQNRPTLPSNRQISIHRQTTRKSFSSSGSLHCSDPASISPTPCKTALLPARSMSHGGAPRSAVQRSDRRTPLTGGGLPPVADLLAWNPKLLTYIGHGRMGRIPQCGPLGKCSSCDGSRPKPGHASDSARKFAYLQIGER
jgi:hypothetical protein